MGTGTLKDVDQTGVWCGFWIKNKLDYLMAIPHHRTTKSLNKHPHSTALPTSSLHINKLCHHYHGHLIIVKEANAGNCFKNAVEA
eukprot:scaffold4059_cov177-Amphora_coffeaeformis.AAC.13